MLRRDASTNAPQHFQVVAVLQGKSIQVTVTNTELLQCGHTTVGRVLNVSNICFVKLQSHQVGQFVQVRKPFATPQRETCQTGELLKRGQVASANPFCIEVTIRQLFEVQQQAKRVLTESLEVYFCQLRVREHQGFEEDVWGRSCTYSKVSKT